MKLVRNGMRGQTVSLFQMCIHWRNATGKPLLSPSRPTERPQEMERGLWRTLHWEEGLGKKLGRKDWEDWVGGQRPKTLFTFSPRSIVLDAPNPLTSDVEPDAARPRARCVYTHAT